MTGAISRLLIVDQSLKGPGGHHFDCTLQIAKSAIRRGFALAIGAHRKFQDQQEMWRGIAGDLQEPEEPAAHPSTIDQTCQIYPCFNLTTYSHRSDLGGSFSDAVEKTGWLRKIKEWLRHQDALQRSLPDRHIDQSLIAFTDHLTPSQRQVVRVFSRNLVHFLERTDAKPEDVIFFSTVSELEFLAMGLVAAVYPEKSPGSWHAQFHFSALTGRPHEYAAQRQSLKYLRARESFSRARTGFSNVAISCYTTSQELADQYNLFDRGRFEPLPYPVNPRFGQQIEQSQGSRPIRITLAGGVRREKGQGQLAEVMNGVADSLLKTKKAKLVLQSGAKHRGRSTTDSGFRGESGAPEWLEYVEHPLPEQKYVQLIQQADLGLLMYDSRAYYARRAGVLGEFFASGVPVIVPAACWLGEQVQQVNRGYWRALFREGVPVTSNLVLQSRGSLGEVTPREATAAVVVRGHVADPPEGLRHLTLGWQTLKGPMSRGDYCLNRWSATIDEQGEFWCLLPVLESWQSIPLRLSIRWSFSEGSVQLRDLHLREVASTTEQPLPWGKVGLVAVDNEQVPGLLTHVVSQYRQYRAAAREYASCWFAEHDPEKTVERLFQPENKIVPKRMAKRAA